MYIFPATSSQRINPHYHNGRFANYAGEQRKAFVVPSLVAYAQRMMRASTRTADAARIWHALDEPAHQVPADRVRHDYAPRITWIGHASFLLEFEPSTSRPFRILLDPVFDDLTWLLPRYTYQGVARHALPPIDYVLISHNHWDHLEKKTAIHLAQTSNPLFLVPQGDAYWLQRWGVTNVLEHTWWDQHQSEHVPGLRCTFLPAYHWSKRGLFDDNRSLWGSWMIEYSGYVCYFAGDTAYANHFAAIAAEFPAIDTVLMPIGPCEPSAQLRRSHISPEQAGMAFLDLKARSLIPMHWGTYGFGVDQALAPLDRMHLWWRERIGPDVSSYDSPLFCPLRIGHSTRL